MILFNPSQFSIIYLKKNVFKCYEGFFYFLILESPRMSTTIYHGSFINAIKIKPELDEDNKVIPILGSLNREQAVEKGLRDLLEQTHILKDFSLVDNVLRIELDWKSPILTRIMLEKKIVYLYSFIHNSKSKWMRITKDNELTDCFYTEELASPIDKARILMSVWLRDKKIYIKHARA